MLDSPGNNLIHLTPQLPSSRFCSGCGRTLAELRKTSRVGCATCYEAFGDLLAQSIERLHGRSTHPLAEPSSSVVPVSSFCPDFCLKSLEPEQLRWLSGSGSDSDVILSSRLRLARNLASTTFPEAGDEAHRQKSWSRISAAIAERLPHWGILPLAKLAPERLGLLMERHMIPRITSQPQGHALASSFQGYLSVCINDEDHLRLQSLDSGLTLRRDLAEVEHHAALLERCLGFAQNTRLGYLTACPSNLGSGLRASVLVHLPALAWMDALAEVARKIAATSGLTLRGPHGESSDLGSPFLQLSNQITLGHHDLELVAGVESMALSLAEWERRARERALSEHKTRLEDAAWRAWGLLSHARLLERDEYLDLLSMARLGQLCRLLPERPDLSRVAHLLVASEPAHLRTWQGAITQEEPERTRASWLRTVWAEGGNI